MNITEMKKHQWVVSWSGGKDSTATIILMHQYHVPIKEIVYVRMMYDNDTPATLPEVTDYIDRASNKFKEWGYRVKIITSKKTALNVASTIYKKSKYPDRVGKPYGMTAFCRRHCIFQKVKQKTVESLLDDRDYQMIGYTSDELDRIGRLGDKKQSILVALGLEEVDAFRICLKYEMLNPLYFTGILRDGCFFCPSAANKERLNLHKNHPELVSKIYYLIEMGQFDMRKLSNVNVWVRDYYKRKDSKQLSFL